jgi:hypothetical protein
MSYTQVAFRQKTVKYIQILVQIIHGKVQIGH